MLDLSADRSAVASPPPTARSAVANGSRLRIDNIDGRSAEYRRFKDALADLIQYLGGADQATEPQKHLARRAAALVVWCEKAETALARGDEMNVATYTTATNALRRLLADIGLERRTQDVTPSLSKHLERLTDSPEPQASTSKAEEVAADTGPDTPAAAGEPSLTLPDPSSAAGEAHVPAAVGALGEAGSIDGTGQRGGF